MSVSFSPNGSRLLTLQREREMASRAGLWDGATGARVELLHHEAGIEFATFSPDGARVVTASWDCTARIWDAETGTLIGQVLRHDDGVNSAAFSPDGTRVVTASGDCTARIWDAVTGAPLCQPLKHEGEVLSATFSPDGTRVATAANDYTARIWNAVTGAPIGQPLRHEGERFLAKHVVSAHFSLDGKRVITKFEMPWAEDTVEAQIWDAATGEPIGSRLCHASRVEFVAISPDRTRVVTRASDHTARIWDAVTSELLAEIEVLDSEGVAFSPDSARIVIWSNWEGGVEFSPPGKPIDRPPTQIWKCIAIARIFDVATGMPIGQPMQHEQRLNDAAFSPDGTRVVAASDDKTAQVWDADTGAPIGPPLLHETTVFEAKFSPDGKRIVTVTEDAAQLWDAATGTRIGAPLTHGT
jgi:WD40 repeat protein